jgi:hypothetical protein
MHFFVGCPRRVNLKQLHSRVIDGPLQRRVIPTGSRNSVNQNPHGSGISREPF